MFVSPEPVRADDTFLDEYSLSEKGIFTKNRISLEILQGYFTDIDLGPETPDFKYTQTALRLGWMLTNPGPSRFLPEGNWELMFELCRSVVTEGPGNDMEGFSALLRYNFVSPGRRLIPFIQGGCGIIFNDVYKDRSQDAIGQDLEFTPQIGLGIQYMLTSNWSIIAEGKCHHISNAGLSNRNDGMNALGASIGFAYFF
jgi:hypothetical protein